LIAKSDIRTEIEIFDTDSSRTSIC